MNTVKKNREDLLQASRSKHREEWVYSCVSTPKCRTKSQLFNCQ